MSLSAVATALAVFVSCGTAGHPGAVAASDTVSARRPLRGDDTVVSEKGKFELGLFSPGSSGRFYLGIWYKNVPGQTVIWVGNRESPLSSVASAELRVSTDDGNLELVGLSQSSASPGVVWSSNLSSSTAAASAPGSNVAVMRDNGNLVLVDGGNSSNVLWQSFDHPTDTLVPEAWLGENKITGEYQTLTSWRNVEDPAPGMFTDTVDRNGSSEFFYLWNGSRPYWRSGVWTGRVFANLPEAVRNVLFNQTYVETPAYRRVTSVLYNNATITRMVLDVTGQTKQYIWVGDSQSWQLFWAAPTVPCDAYALCGAFGICNKRSQPPCQCPPGFAPAAEQDWGLSDWSGGCRRSAPLRCGGNASTDGFLEIPGMKLPDDPFAVSAPQSRAECELACLNNCSCQAYTFSGRGSCAVWHDGFRNLEQLYADDGDSPSSLYLRLSGSELQHLRGAKGKNRRSLWPVLGIVLACLAALGASALVACMLRSRRSKRLEKMANQSCSSLQVYSYGELRAATKNFSERLGGGGFGAVYRGVVNGHTEVAVKKLEGLRQGDKQFRTEVNTLGLIQHVNLVRLVGFCPSSDQKMLVYEYMPNGSLDSYLFGSSPCLCWRDRYGIMLGIARGLAYLHDGCRECIIHCDIKPENILLDKDLCPKIADFGMAKLLGRDFSQVLTTIRGTIGYLAPEWISGLPISAKSDVYSFGMVLFELISGRRNSAEGHDGDGSREGEVARQHPSKFFPVWAAARVVEGDTAAVVDRRLFGDVGEGELERACRVACWCIQDQEAHRPTMHGSGRAGAGGRYRCLRATGAQGTPAPRDTDMIYKLSHDKCIHWCTIADVTN
ncbi:G-type lectin S-receptor-like serine/threonine-protein kinase [Dichanthelium oligosanthes]|uniref:Receptor-like serine/threonine-protein kinase n=1 Tax=Dichanthelium oligosanthes TaxID=888268 RepID=A0A1E5UR82_9POAL|nr:G-type lectin S-receptor-like serine/threonine-protein kinase [Dichanthelium oligosanthes]